MNCGFGGVCVCLTLSKIIEMRFLLVLGSWLLILTSAFAQSADGDGYKKFYYPDGTIQSEGTIKKGKPDGYWKTYYKNGKLKSEGNRLDYKLDSLWKFYNEAGKTTLEINYKADKKQGDRKTYAVLGWLEKKEVFSNDTLQGNSEYYFENGKLWKTIPFVKGKTIGFGYEYAADDGRIITITEFKNGYQTKLEKINEKDKFNQKQGIWKEFYPDTFSVDKGKRLHIEGKYLNDKKNGYFKEYDTEGNLITTTKYKDGILEPEPAELAKLDIKRDFYPDATEKFRGSYNKGVPEGVHRFYNEKGEVDNSKIFRRGILVGEGIYDDQGIKQGLWKEYYDTGELRSEGKYEAGTRVGEWKFYYKNGKLDQKGKYIKGKPEGDWRWFYENGNPWREEIYSKGKEDGSAVEYNDTGLVVAKGEFIEGEKEGLWNYQYGDFREEGSYKDGQQDGEWKSWYKNGELSFEGKYINGLEDGKHVWYYDNGKVREEGKYILGSREGVWKKYDPEGLEAIEITYENNKEIKVDGIKVKPSDEEQE